MLSFKPTFSLSSFIFIKRLFSSSSFHLYMLHLYMLSPYLYVLTLEVSNVLMLTFPGMPFLISLTRSKSPFIISLKITYLFVVFIKCCNFLFLLFVSMFSYKGNSIQHSVVSQCLAESLKQLDTHIS